MIPNIISPEIKSGAERKIFEWFKNSTDTTDWIILHSLGIANHSTLIYGEIDFLVLAPKLGIFALEVKGGRVGRADGVWSFTNRYGNTNTKSRSPFEQAHEGIFSIMEAIKKTGNIRLSSLLFGSGVMFPDIVFETEGVDTHQWQVFDRRDGENVGAFIRRLAENCRREWQETYKSFPADKTPDVQAIKDLAQFLRGDFDKVVPLASRIQDAEKELIKLTSEQLLCLDSLEDNPRCLIHGAAGTGKTLLALENAKRSIISGEKTAFFCFNVMLGDWVKKSFESSGILPNFAGTFHDFLLQTIKNTGIQVTIPLQDIEQSQFWQIDLPMMFFEAVEKNPIRFDKIIIDEAQDLITSEYLEVFNEILENGIARGKWTMFADFSRQAIFLDNVSSEKLKDMIASCASYTNYHLHVNCRNTKQIGSAIQALTGFDTKAYINTAIDGCPVRYCTWHNIEDQKEQLETILSNLIQKEGIAAEDITILSPVHKEKSVVDSISHKITNYEVQHKGLTFSTIRRFKGLENAVIILTDVTSFDNSKVIYVGSSRARSMLIVFESDKAHRQRVSH
ncbi:MAG: NERD domain-containing protein [Fusobacteriaceae bacterium]|nr:NERD domain-containing protein [Fusobacteriaceae bacterium]